MSSQNPIRVMIVDDHDMVRRGLAVFLRAFEDMELVAEAAGGEDAIGLIAEAQPNVVLMDLVMPGLGGVSATRRIRKEFPDVQVVALTSFKDEQLVHEALQAGAIGYLLKNVSIDDLAAAIRAASEGKPTLAPEATQVLIDKATREPSYRYNLTERELDVLGLMVQGSTNKQIAAELSVSLSTVKFHVSSILAKLGVSSRTEAVALAMQHGLV